MRFVRERTYEALLSDAIKSKPVDLDTVAANLRNGWRPRRDTLLRVVDQAISMRDTLAAVANLDYPDGAPLTDDAGDLWDAVERALAALIAEAGQ